MQKTQNVHLEKKAAAPVPPDYSSDYCWVSKPGNIDKKVDVFYVHPTIYTAKSPDNMDISTPELRAYAQGLCIAQAGIYSESANLFAPFYRQQTAAVQDAFTAAGGTDMFIDPSFQLGAGDVGTAFAYYLENLNPDRPFIIAGHSQGTMTLIDLMRKKFHDPKLMKRLIAAYLIGYSVTKDDFKTYPWMKLAQGADDTGVIITYNTEGPGASGSPVYLGWGRSDQSAQLEDGHDSGRGDWSIGAQCFLMMRPGKR